MTFAQAFANTGGFMTIVFLVTLILVQRLQATIYFTTLIKSIYKHQPVNLHKKEPENKETNGINKGLLKNLKDTIVKTILEQINARNRFIYGISDELKAIFITYLCCCCKLTER